MEFDKKLLSFLACPACGGALELDSTGKILSCARKRQYPVLEGRAYFREPPADAPLSHSNTDRSRWTDWRRANYDYFKENLEAAFPDSSGEKVILDLGAGSSQFRSLTENFSKTISVDFTPQELVNVVADLTGHLPFREGFADAALLSNVLDHVPYPSRILRESHRVIKPGGMILGAAAFLLHANQLPYDYFRYTHVALERMLNEAGFKKVKVVPLGRAFDVYSSMERRFFRLLLAESGFLARSAWAITRLVNYFFRPLYRRMISTVEYTEGFGFQGFKQHTIEAKPL